LSAPHETPDGQLGAQTQTPCEHIMPVAQVPLHIPPHPSLAPHVEPVGQLGVQAQLSTHLPFWQ
jgi:hypothetical protein